MYWNTKRGLKVKVQKWLTLTWDVLKCNESRKDLSAILININMRCIEMKQLLMIS